MKPPLPDRVRQERNEGRERKREASDLIEPDNESDTAYLENPYEMDITAGDSKYVQFKGEERDRMKDYNSTNEYNEESVETASFPDPRVLHENIQMMSKSLTNYLAGKQADMQ